MAQLNSQRADNTGGNGNPGGIFKYLLLAACFKRKHLHPRAVSPDHPATHETPGGTGNQHIAVKRRRKLIGLDAFTPDFVARPVFAK
jgi:hypothetical protein